jgi:hypothetical protein
LAFAVVFSACGADGKDGKDGMQGAVGAQGEGGTGPSGPVGPPGDSLDGGLSVSCLSPCHGFNGIVEQWKTSSHYAVYVANLGGTEVDTWTGAQACGNCHAADALTSRAAGFVNAPGSDGGVLNVKNGMLAYRQASANSGMSESTYPGNVKVAAVTCTTCHDVNPGNDPHRTGAPNFTPGSFPWRVPVGMNDVAFISKSPNTSAVTGQSAGTRGFGNICIWCHRSRKDVTNYITAGATNNISQYWGPHEGPQADVFTGKGGYQYQFVNYGTATHEQQLTCPDCHMPDVQTNGGFPDHSFYAQLSVCAKTCHTGATSFDMNGAQTKFYGAAPTNSNMREFQAALNAAGLITRSQPNGLTNAELGDGQWALDQGRAASNVDADKAGALYNYMLLARGSAKVAHNPKYCRQLFWDSIVALTGSNPTSLQARP